MVSLVTDQLTIAHHTISLSPPAPEIDSTCSANRWSCCQGDVHLESKNVSMGKNSSLIFINDVISQQESHVLQRHYVSVTAGQLNCGKVMFSQVLSVHRGGGMWYGSPSSCRETPPVGTSSGGHRNSGQYARILARIFTFGIRV